MWQIDGIEMVQDTKTERTLCNIRQPRWALCDRSCLHFDPWGFCSGSENFGVLMKSQSSLSEACAYAIVLSKSYYISLIRNFLMVQSEFQNTLIGLICK